MDLAPYVNQLQQALTAATGSASAEVQQAADRIARALEPAMRLSLMELAADVAAEATVQLDGDVVDVRLRGGSPEVVVERRSPEPVPAPPPPPAPAEEDGGTARISLRLPESLKAEVDRAASREGVSVNTWLVRSAQSALSPRSPQQTSRSARHLSGWVR